jgi:hypothetical protein
MKTKQFGLKINSFYTIFLSGAIVAIPSGLLKLCHHLPLNGQHWHYMEDGR